MRLLIDAHVFDGLSQGSKTYIKGMYASVLAGNVTDEFFFAADNLSSVERELGIHPNVHSTQFTHTSKYARLGWEITSLIRKHKIDWAHFQYISPLRKTCLEIVTVHDLLFLDFPQYFPAPYRLVKHYLFKRSAKRADWVLTVSEYSKDAIIRHFGIASDKVVVTPNGVLDYFWEPFASTSDISTRYSIGNFILYVSRFEPRKNQVGLLLAYRALGLWKENVQLIFVGGKGIQSDGFDKAYASLSAEVRRHIFFLEDVSLPDLKWLYQNCRLFAYPSYAEGFGIPPLEAMACNANVICAGTTAMSEFTFLGDRLFDPRDPIELKEKLRFYLDNPQFPQREVTRELIRQNYSWELSASRIMGLLGG